VAARSKRRIGIVATGGLSHDPGEKNHGVIDSNFDRQFMSAMAAGNAERLGKYTRSELAGAGAGAFELLSWVALAGALNGKKGEVVAYEAVKPWATGVGLMAFPHAAAA
jgi:protocatechuate 4,5-dioxygenase beta chain